jgi:alkylation response protein AidB-like acyl-CoA dehydrogenase
MLPHAKLWDEKEIFPTEVLKKAGALGFGSIYCRFPVSVTSWSDSVDFQSDNLCRPEYGGSDLGRLGAAVVFEALSTACPSTTA